MNRNVLQSVFLPIARRCMQRLGAFKIQPEQECLIKQAVPQTQADETPDQAIHADHEELNMRQEPVPAPGESVDLSAQNEGADLAVQCGNSCPEGELEEHREIVDDAKTHMRDALKSGSLPFPASLRWEMYLDRIRSLADLIVTARDAVTCAQEKIGFTHIRPVHASWLSFYEDCLKQEFPQSDKLIASASESKYSRIHLVSELNGRSVSNLLFYNLRTMLRLEAWADRLDVLCEIGSGYGDLARLFLLNGSRRPKTIILVDFPECLFFSEVFLRANIPDLNSLYVKDSRALNPVESSPSVIFCPIQHVSALKGFEIDFVVNTGSMQEMSEEWVDFWMNWLDEQNCRYFYSLNYFAQALDYMGEGANLWSPRLSREWTVRVQRFNPEFIIAHTILTRNFAEILAEKAAGALPADALSNSYKLLKRRRLDGQVLLEAMDIARLSDNEEIIWDLLVWSVGMDPVPKEALYLCQHLIGNGSPGFKAERGEKLGLLSDRLMRLREGGTENLIPAY